MLFRIILLLRRIKPEIIQSQHFYTNLYSAISGWFLNIISIGASRNDLKIEIKDNGIFGMLSFKLPDYFISNSRPSFEYAKLLGRDKSSIYYLPNALDTNRFSPRLPGHEDIITPFVLLAIGRLEKQKRFDKFIDLIIRLKKTFGANVKGVLIGDGVLETDLRQYAQDSGLSENDIEFISNSAEPEVYFRKASLFVLASDYEGTPNVVLEAMACGLPVVSTKVGNLPFIINDREDGFFFDGGVDNLFKIVNEVMNDNGLLNKVSKNAIQKIENCFSIKVLETNLDSIYNSIMNN